MQLAAHRMLNNMSGPDSGRGPGKLCAGAFLARVGAGVVVEARGQHCRCKTRLNTVQHPFPAPNFLHLIVLRT